MKTHTTPIVRTNHYSLRETLRYTPPNPDYNRFASLAVSQHLGPIPKKKFYDYGYVGNYESFLSYTGNSSSSEEDAPPSLTPCTGLRKRNVAQEAPSTPLNLRASSNQVPTPTVGRAAARTKSFFDQQYPELDAPQKTSNYIDFSISSSETENEGNLSDDYSDSPGLFGAW